MRLVNVASTGVAAERRGSMASASSETGRNFVLCSTGAAYLYACAAMTPTYHPISARCKAASSATRITANRVFI